MKSLLQPARTWRTLRHFRLESVAYRVHLRLLRLLLPVHRKAWGRPAPEFKAALPRPVLPARGNLIQDGEERLATPLGSTAIELASPVGWHQPRPHLDALNLHAMGYLGSLSESKARALVLDWIQANPLTMPNPWHAAWHPFALSIRVVAWLQAWACQSWPTTGEDSATIRQSLGTQLRCLVRHLEKDVRGNHLIKNIKALLWGSACFSGPEAKLWQALGTHLLLEELPEQILTDGMHFELSPSYHLQVLEDLIECSAVFPLGEDREPLDRVLDAMAKVAGMLRHPDGGPSLFADGGLKTARSPAELLAALKEATPAEPPCGPFALPAAGYFGFHATGETFIADAGLLARDHLPAHGHGDLFAFEWSVGGHRVIVDTGVFEYREGPRRAHARSTLAHNTVTVGDEDQGEFWSSFRLGRRAKPLGVRWHMRERGLALSGSHDGFAHLPGNPVHTRTFDAQPGLVKVRDEVTGGAGQPVCARLLLHPSCEVVPTKHGALIQWPSGQIHLHTESEVTVEAAPWWPDMGVEVPTRRILIHHGAAPCQGTFDLVHTPTSEESP